jgi:hypothetical protein
MFDFLHRSGMRRPSAAIVRTLVADGLPPGTDVSALGVVGSRGWYADRKVDFFRVFDPTRAAAHGGAAFARLAYEDLDALPDLVLRAGYVERDGRVVLFSRPPATFDMSPSRERAVGPARPDDERVVSPHADR